MVHTALLGLALATCLGMIIVFVMFLFGASKLKPLSTAPVVSTGRTVSVIVAARDEGPHIEAALQSLLDQKYDGLEIIAVDDRSADDTGAILDRMSAADSRLRVIHVTELPPSWLGKNHALHTAAKVARGELLLFTDADVVFAPDAIARSVAFMEARALDHLTLGPELDSPGNWLSLVVTFFSLGFFLLFKPWHASNPERDEHIGIGAFNLVRASLYHGFGGHSRIPLRPDDDIKLGRLVKLAGGRQLLAGGIGAIRVRWYSTVGELARGLRKNTFAGLNYSLPIAIGGIVVQLAVNVWPFVAVFVTSGAIWWLNVVTAALLMSMFMFVAYGAGSKLWLAIGYPLAALIFVYIVATATWYTVSRGGIEWRGTFYPLDELKKNVV